MQIVIQDLQKFLDLIPAGQNYLDLWLNINVAAAVNTPLETLPFGDSAVSTVDAELKFDGGECFFGQSRTGKIVHQVDHVEVSTEYTGFFAGFSVGGANRVLSLPVRICRPAGGAALPSLSIGSGNVGTSDAAVDSYAQSSISLKLNLTGSLLTLPDGTPLSSLVPYTLEPACPASGINAPRDLLLLD